jgi:hypothetical protein
MTKGKRFVIEFNDTTVVDTTKFRLTIEHLEALLTVMNLLHVKELSQSIMNNMFLQCDMMMLVTDGDTLKIRKYD